MINFRKDFLSHEGLYISKFTFEEAKPYLIFIHGGPGYNCGLTEYLIENECLFSTLNYNLILYDQRGCGRSANFEENILHEENVHDLDKIFHYLTEVENININGFIGHSYGAKLLFDFYKIFKLNMPGIFIATADNLMAPRLNNLMIDFAYLKSTDKSKYQEILRGIDKLDMMEIWELTEDLAPLFQQNKNRPFFYWANLDWFEKCQKAQKLVNLPINQQTFMGIRKDLYTNENNFSVSIDSLSNPYLWVNGFHDFIMNSAIKSFQAQTNIVQFYKSAHYPHIEENIRFCEVVNGFIK